MSLNKAINCFLNYWENVSWLKFDILNAMTTGRSTGQEDIKHAAIHYWNNHRLALDLHKHFIRLDINAFKITHLHASIWLQWFICMQACDWTSNDCSLRVTECVNTIYGWQLVVLVCMHVGDANTAPIEGLTQTQQKPYRRKERKELNEKKGWKGRGTSIDTVESINRENKRVNNLKKKNKAFRSESPFMVHQQVALV